MSEKFEQLSAWVDGEASTTRVDDVKADVQLQQKWQDYHLMGDTLRGDEVLLTDKSLLESIADALDDEPTVLAPSTKSRVIPIWQNVVSLGKQSSQFAVAAGVAAVMILGVQNYNTEATQPFMTAPTSGPQGGLAPVSLSQSRTIQTPEQQLNERQALLEQRKRINALLVDHQQQVRLQAAQITTNEQSEKQVNPD
ncbi:MAG: sigma-E factor negative regulatory protein [Glaciecola sp.]|jgi:sigma-E factor negative regulatory protein RseA|uniref:sigma-E factor negative regulatory protein n=1 Tax=Glaciecola sp. HTCC2999 TaxID=455436 RepID=UPI0000E1152A|nr:RseA family anti-sigma factor [Glaciecola sp. HTCC2999]